MSLWADKERTIRKGDLKMLTQEQIERMYNEMGLKSRKDQFVKIGMDERMASIFEEIEQTSESLQILEQTQKLMEEPLLVPDSETDFRTYLDSNGVGDNYGELARNPLGCNQIR
jgi:hypothetical protein